MKKQSLTDSIGDIETRSKGNHMYAVRNLVTSIFLAELHLCLMNVPLHSTTFCLDLDRSGWCKGLPLLLGKWIRDGHDSLGNSTHNLSDQEDPFTVCQSDAAVAS
jgi:hypothetical protein